MKICTKCRTEKSLSEFSKNGSGLRSHCKPCVKIYKQANKERISVRQKVWMAENAEHVADLKRRYRAENSERVRQYKREYNEKNKEKIAETRRIYNQKNKQVIKEYSSKRYADNKGYYQAHNKAWHEKNREHRDAYVKRYREENKEAKAKAERRRISSKIKATPKWSDKEAIKAIYDMADKIGGVHVDHIVPLRSKIVCGLHVHWNLQILTPEENMAKGNWWWPDMPG